MDVRRLYPFLNEKDELDYLGESKSGNGGKNGWMALYPSSNAPGWSQRGGGGGRYNHGSKSASNFMIPRNIVLDDCDQRNQNVIGAYQVFLFQEQEQCYLQHRYS